MHTVLQWIAFFRSLSFYHNPALLYHPDTAPTKNGNQSDASAAQFIRISEAWGVLSRPESRTKYDTLRGRYLGVTAPHRFGSLASQNPAAYEPVHSNIPVGFEMQRSNHTAVQQKAGATYADTQEKMIHDKWQSMPLSEKKVLKRAICMPYFICRL